MGNLSFGNVETFRYMGVTVTNTNYIREGIKRRKNMGNACNCVCVFQCQPTALLRASGSAQGG